MSSETIAAILGALVGGICTAIISFITISIQRKRRIIGYEVSSIPLVRFMSTTDQSVKLTVDKSLLTGQPMDKGVFTPIDTAYGFEITLRNIGNEDIEDPKIELHLDPSAKIVAYETQPSNTPAYEVRVEKDDLHPNVIRFSVPFINQSSQFLVRLISADNANNKCKIEVYGLGIRIRRLGYLVIQRLIVGASLVVLPLLLTALLTFSLPSSIITSIGGEIITEPPYSRPIAPIWLLAVTIITSTIGLAIMMMAFIKAVRDRPRKA